MRSLATVLGALLVAAATQAPAEIYRWTDEHGRLHFTESLDKVPARYRAAAQVRARDEKGGTDPLQTYDASPPRVSATAARPLAWVGGRTLQIPFRRSGSLMLVDVRLNDLVTAPFYIDTGASGISLPQTVADQLGIQVGPSTRYVYVHTANGMTSRPVVRLESVQLEGARVEGLEATVNPTMSVGLLGGAFFNNFVYRVDAAAGVIELRQNPAIRGGAGEEEWRERFRRARRPLQELEQHLEGREITRPDRRAELEARRSELRQRLEALEDQADRLGVPQAWRDG
jgi:clan AA aspartic protease (TIGR02281 family)